MTTTDTPVVLQFLSGRDHATGSTAALQMRNLSYVVADPASRAALLVDPSWDPVGLARLAEDRGYTVAGVLATHDHPDHVGGNLYGLAVPGLDALVRSHDVPVHVHVADRVRLVQRCRLPEDRVVGHADGARIPVGALAVEVIHTPGHTPGSACFLAGSDLLTGDTLFVMGCGRVDLPVSDPEAMFRSLARLAGLPGHLRILPGHDYGGMEERLARVLELNSTLRAAARGDWSEWMELP